MKTAKYVHLMTFALSGFALPVVGCSEPLGEEEVRSKGLALHANFDTDGDVEGVRYDITRVSCAGETIDPLMSSVTVDLHEGIIPGGTTLFSVEQLDPDSEHHFADLLIHLPEGCYDIVASPLDDMGAPSGVCAPTQVTGVQVQDGETTEVLLISQCTPGSGSGSLDAVTALNWPPLAENVQVTDGKFAARCEDVEVCVTFSDPDHDPMEIEWSVVGAPANGPNVTVTSSTSGDGTITECATVNGSAAGSFQLQATAFDLMVDGNGNPIRIEDFHTLRGVPELSRNEQVVPLHILSGDSQCACAYATMESAGNPTIFGWIDLITGSFSQLGANSALSFASDITYDHATGRLYAIANAFNGPRLVELDQSNGQELSSLPITLGPGQPNITHCESLAVDSSDGRFYAGCSFVVGPISRQVIVIDPVTGLATDNGAISGVVQNDLDGLTFVDSQLYGADSNGSNALELYIVDHDNAGAVTMVRDDYSIGEFSHENISYQPSTDILWSLNNSGIQQIDPGTGVIASDLVAPIDSATFSGYAYRGLAVAGDCF